MNEATSAGQRHEANRRSWDARAHEWKQMRDADELWRRCPSQPDLAFDGGALDALRSFSGDLTGKHVCVIGSGDNYVAFALAGMGAIVTSTDISANQLSIAAHRAEEMGLDIRFIRTDAADLETIGNAEYDLVCSSNGFFVWIAEPGGVFSSVSRILKPGGHYIFYDIHPFLRPWKDQVTPIEMAKPYFETGPFRYDESEGPSYEFSWTLSDIVNPLLNAGLMLRKIIESPPKDSRFWQDFSYQPGSDDALLDWHSNPRAGLPVWMTLVAEKPDPDAAQPGIPS